MIPEKKLMELNEHSMAQAEQSLLKMGAVIGRRDANGEFPAKDWVHGISIYVSAYSGMLCGIVNEMMGDVDPRLVAREAATRLRQFMELEIASTIQAGEVKAKGWKLRQNSTPTPGVGPTEGEW